MSARYVFTAMLAVLCGFTALMAIDVWPMLDSLAERIAFAALPVLAVCMAVAVWRSP